MRLRMGGGGWIALLAFAAGGCAEPLVFPDWTLPVEEDTPLREYAWVPPGERRDTIEWVEAMIIGDRGDTDIRYAFTQPSDVTVDARGQIHVVDSRDVSVKVFDASGAYLRELGREGQGPGEFQDPRSIASLPDRVVVGASRNARWSHFDLDGNHIADYAYPIYDNLEAQIATASGEIVGLTLSFERPDEVIRGLGRYSPEAELLQTVVELRFTQVPTIGRAGGGGFYLGAMPQAYPQAAPTVEGGAYWSTSDEYQILAVDRDGAQRWALRVAWTPGLLPRAQIDDLMEQVRRYREDATESEVNFPDRQPAVAGMLVDGHGHLYVFPYVYLPSDADPGTPVPVDVYSVDGERLFSGLSVRRRWMHADGDHVWEIGPDPVSEENVVRKLRPIEPFD